MNLEKEIFDIALQDIIPNRFQPREIFNDDELSELAESIKQHGVIQPIIVRKVGDKYEIIAGERRFRASQLAGKQTIPALVRDIDDKEAAKIALLENLQRSNLTPIEEAKTYQTILKIDNITQDELAQNLGKSQSAIANKLRLLSLNEEVQTALLNSQISERHARSLLGLTNEEQLELLHKTINEKLTVRQLDEEILKMTGKAPGDVIEEQEGGINMEENNMFTPNQNPDEPNISSNSEVLNTTIPGLENNNEVQSPIIPETNIEVPAQTAAQPQEAPNTIDMNNIFPKVELPEHEQESKVVEQEEPIMPNTNNIEQPEITPMPNIELPSIEEPKEEEPEVTPQPETTLTIELPKIEEQPQEVQPAVEPIQQEMPKREENIFDKLRVTRDETPQENKFNLPTPDLSAVINSNPEPIQQETPQEQEQTYENAYDLRFAINNFRQAVQNTEKFGFKVNTTENDLEDKYQIVIEIDKK